MRICKQTVLFFSLFLLLITLNGCGGGSSAPSSSSDSSSSTSSSSSSSGASARLAYWMVFQADKETAEVDELYGVLDDGSIEPIKLSAADDEAMQTGRFWVSSNGAYVAFLARKDIDTNGVFDGDDGPLALYVAPTDGSESAIQVSGPVQPHTHFSHVAWAPNDNRLAFRANIDQQDAYEIYLVKEFSTGAVKINGDTAGVVEMGEFLWSPDGRYIAQYVLNKTRRYISDRIAINNHDTSLDASNSTRLTGPLLPGSTYDFSDGWDGANISIMHWSPDSSRIVYMLDDHRTGDTRRYFQAFPDGGYENVTGPLATDENGGLNYTWSPDGRYLAYEVVTAGVGANVVEVFDSVEQSHHRVVSLPAGGRIIPRTDAIRWRPGATQFAIAMSLSADGPYHPFLFEQSDEGIVDPTPVATVEADHDLEDYRWSPSGDYLAYVQEDTGEPDRSWTLFTLDPDTTPEPVPVSGEIPSSYDNNTYYWLPSGDALLYLTDAGHFIAPPGVSNEASSVSAGLDVDLQPEANWTRVDARVMNTPLELAAQTVGMLAINPDTNVPGLYTNRTDGSELTELAGDMVEGGEVRQFSYARPSVR